MMLRPKPLALALAALVAMFLLTPLLAIAPISLTPARFLTMPHGEYSLTHYRDLVDNPDWAASAWLSLKVGVASSGMSRNAATSAASASAIGRGRSFIARPRAAPAWRSGRGRRAAARQ